MTPELSQVEGLVLQALLCIEGPATAIAISQTIRRALANSASVGRIYIAFGALSDRGLVRIRNGQIVQGGRTKTQTVAQLTERGRFMARQLSAPSR